MRLRYERKYLAPIHILDDLRMAISPFVRSDTMAKMTAGFPEYTVRSIYLDTPSRDAVYEKLEGLRNRKKLRIRGYDSFHEDNAVFLEIKRKISNRIGKNRAQIRYRNLLDVLDWGQVEESLIHPDHRNLDDANKFLFNFKRYQMQPVNLIVYDREPYHGLMDAGVRITFDKNIRSRLFPTYHELYDDLDYEYPWKNHFILEIKYFDPPMPSWARSIVQQFGLKVQALSKYVEGYTCHPIIKA